jgi:ABC-type phosphonate transport system ATPase subunit
LRASWAIRMGGWDGLTMAALIELAGLTKRYGATVGIQQLDLEVEAGEVFGFLGPNGAGKTTTFNDGDFEARQAGEDVGLQVWAKAKAYFNGKAIPQT